MHARSENLSERFWLQQYPEGVPTEIDVTQYTSLTSSLNSRLANIATVKPIFVWTSP